MISRRTVVTGIGAALLAPAHGYASRHIDDTWGRALRTFLNGQREHAARYLRLAPGYPEYMTTSAEILGAAKHYEPEPVRAAVPLQWVADLALNANAARVLAESMRAWPGTGIPAYRRAYSCPYSVALLLIRHEIAWTELEDHPSLIWLSMQAERRRVLPIVAKRMSELIGRSLSLRGVSVVARRTQEKKTAPPVAGRTLERRGDATADDR